ncbi:MAG: hypothetical protein ABR526_01545, partial [Chthoniobacterales bacterium]
MAQRRVQTSVFDTDVDWGGSRQRNWLLVGLLVSLLLHSALCFYFYRTQFQRPDAALKAPEQTATFNVKSLDA